MSYIYTHTYTHTHTYTKILFYMYNRHTTHALQETIKRVNKPSNSIADNEHTDILHTNIHTHYNQK